MDYKADIAKYTNNINDKAVDAIVKFCGIALQGRDSSLVACSDDVELDRIRKGFATKVLELDDAACNAALKAVCEQMKADTTKHRVTFYYLLAETTGKLSALA